MEYQKIIDKAINKKLVKPLNNALRKYSNRLNSEHKTKHPETIYLLSQSYTSLTNSEDLLKSCSIVDSNVLLRSAFEYLMMGMNIQFNDETYKELIDLSLKDTDRKYTKPTKLISEYRKNFDKISSNFFDDFSERKKEELFSGIYDKLCFYTHGSLLVTTVSRINNPDIKKIYITLGLINIYFVKVLLFISFRYFIDDKNYYIYNESLYFSYIFTTLKALELISKNKAELEIFKDYLYIDKNSEFIHKETKKGKKLQDLFNENSKYLNEKDGILVESLKEFLSLKQ